ncbi:MAG: outer membrane-specific lipoprotein transporter subunit LolC, partial [Deltaproteobacteria bacterium]
MKTVWILMKLAWRNLWRNVRRTLITMVAIGLGLALAMISIGLGDGGHEQM